MIYRIIFLNGPRTGERITVTEEPMCIGRDPACVVHVPDPEAALRHAELVQRGDELFIRDLGSMNRILLNKREVQEAKLKHGDEFELGRTRFLVQAHVQAEVNGTRVDRRRRQTAWAIAATLLMGLVLALSARYVPRGPDAPVETSGLQPPPTNPAIVTRSTPVIPPPLAEDLRLLREDVRTIQETVRALNPPPLPSSRALPALAPPPPVPRSPQEEATDLLPAARDAIASGLYEEAHRLLGHIQAIAPDYLPAYEERARLFERQGKPAEAAAQWSEILRRSTGTPIYQRAVAERIRLGQALAQQARPPDPTLRIASVEHTRFPADEQADEMRVLKIVVHSDSDARPDPERVRLEVEFFDRDQAGAVVEPTAGHVVVQSLAEAEAGAAGELIATATCLIPKGLREQQAGEGEPRFYHGFIVRLLRDGQTIDQYAQPRALLARADGRDDRRAEAVAPPAP